MTTGEIKSILINKLTNVINEHKTRRSAITDAELSTYFNRNRDFNITKEVRADIVLNSDDEYSTFGVNFDRTFGAVASSYALEYEEQLMINLVETLTVKK